MSRWCPSNSMSREHYLQPPHVLMKSEDVTLPGDPAASADLDGKHDEPWTTIITPHRPWFAIDVGELWQYRDLIFLMVRRDLVAQYKQTILGPLWFILQPLLTTVVFTVVFGRIAKIPTEGIPDFLFYLAGTVCWGYFAGCLLQTSDIFLVNAFIFEKIYFPRLVVPIYLAISHIFRFLIQFALFLAFLLYFSLRGAAITMTFWVLALPVLMVQMALLGVGCGMLASAMTTKYRDLHLLVSFGVQLWMFATPVVYPLSIIPAPYRPYFVLNPMASIIEGFRASFLGSSSISGADMAVSWIITLILLVAGLGLFSRVAKICTDTV